MTGTDEDVDQVDWFSQDEHTSLFIAYYMLIYTALTAERGEGLIAV